MKTYTIDRNEIACLRLEIQKTIYQLEKNAAELRMESNFKACQINLATAAKYRETLEAITNLDQLTIITHERYGDGM